MTAARGATTSGAMTSNKAVPDVTCYRCAENSAEHREPTTCAACILAEIPCTHDLWHYFCGECWRVLFT